jgi:hypothetical protein
MRGGSSGSAWLLPLVTVESAGQCHIALRVVSFLTPASCRSTLAPADGRMGPVLDQRRDALRARTRAVLERAWAIDTDKSVVEATKGSSHSVTQEQGTWLRRIPKPAPDRPLADAR